MPPGRSSQSINFSNNRSTGEVTVPRSGNRNFLDTGNRLGFSRDRADQDLRGPLACLYIIGVRVRAVGGECRRELNHLLRYRGMAVERADDRDTRPDLIAYYLQEITL